MNEFVDDHFEEVFFGIFAVVWDALACFERERVDSVVGARGVAYDPALVSFIGVDQVFFEIFDRIPKFEVHGLGKVFYFKKIDNSLRCFFQIISKIFDVFRVGFVVIECKIFARKFHGRIIAFY